MRGIFMVAGFFALFASCGFSPKPKDGLLPCNEGCPDGYHCRTDNRCWLVSTPIPSGGIDAAAAAKDVAIFDIGIDAGPGSTTEAGSDVAVDGTTFSEVAGEMGPGAVDRGGSADTGDSSVDVPVGTGGAGGISDAGGIDRSSVGGAGGGGTTTAGASGGVGGAGGGTGGVGGMVGSGGVGIGTGGTGVAGTVGSGGVAIGTGGTSVGGSVGTGGVVGSGGVVGTGGLIGTGGASVCIPTTDKQCADSTHLKTCGTDGQWPTTGALCPFVCVDNPGNTDVCGGACVPTTDKQCADSTHLKTCGTDGQWPATGGLCPFACIDSPGNIDACGGVCVPGSHQCSGNVLQVCSAAGAWTTETTCVSGTPLCRNNQCVASTPYHVGNDAPLPTPGNPVAYTAPASVLYAVPITVQYQTQVTNFGMVGRSAGNNVVMALYADATPASATPTSPAGRLVSSLATAVTAGSFLVPVTGVIMIQPGNYWLAALHDVAVATYYDVAAGPSAMAAYAILGPPNPYPAIPTAFPTSTPVTGYKYDLYVVLQDY